MKELRIYQPIGHGWYEGDGRALLPVAKHFTDAELAAEYWRLHRQAQMNWARGWASRARGKNSDSHSGRARDAEVKAAVIERFATHPHALEAGHA